MPLPPHRTAHFRTAHFSLPRACHPAFNRLWFLGEWRESSHMFSNLVYFLVVLLVYSTYQPSKEHLLPISAGLLLNALLLAGYWLLARLSFRRLRRVEAATMAAGAGSASSLRYHRSLMHLSMAAIVFFTAGVYFFGFKDAVDSAPMLGRSLALSGLTGLLLFLVYLCVLWGEAFPSYARLYRSRLTRLRFVASQVRFNLPIILPWLFLTGGVDAAAALPWANVKGWILSESGQVVFFVGFLGLLVLIFPVLVRYLWGLTPLPAGPWRTAIESFAERSGFRFAEVMLWPLSEGEALTAGVMGVFRSVRYLLITPALLTVLSPEELEAVLGHELGHVKRHHLLYYVLFFGGYLVLAYALSDLSYYLILLSDRAVDLLIADQGRQGTAATVLLTAPLAVIMIVYFRFVFGAVMRNFERQADLYAYRLLGSSRGLIGSLEKIAYWSGQSRSLPSWHHFSVAQRVEFLEACDRNPELAKAHDRKVRRMMTALVLALVLIGLAGVQVREKGLGEGLNRSLTLRVLEGQARRRPNDPRVYVLLGDVYLRQSRFGEAAAAYEKALALAPGDPVANNNLAWLLATKKNPTQEEKERALLLARMAAGREVQPFILDTLAEAYLVNGRPDAALGVINQALRLLTPRDDRAYFLRQRAKFEAALKKPLAEPEKK